MYWLYWMYRRNWKNTLYIKSEEKLGWPLLLLLCSTLRSWLHQISTRIECCPLDWRTTIHWNVVLAIFQHNHICQHRWKGTRSTFECMVIFQSRGQGPDSCWKYMTDLSRSFPSFWTLSPGFENNHTFKCWSGIFPTILTYMIMLENGQNKISVYGCSPIQGTKFYSCWNLMKPGSQSGTYMIRIWIFHMPLI